MTSHFTDVLALIGKVLPYKMLCKLFNLPVPGGMTMLNMNVATGKDHC